MIPRYTPPEMAAVFSDEARLRWWLEVELLNAEAWAEHDPVRVPAASAAKLRALLTSTTIDPRRVAELEAEQGHDVAAFVSAVQEIAGDEGRLVHLGLTSSDVVDTALARQLLDAGRLLDRDAAVLEGTLRELAIRHRRTLMPGRTHGVHAEPLTLGVKLVAHLDEVARSRARLASAFAEVAVGQLSGPVGTHTSIPPEVEARVCGRLGLPVAAVATQVLARDRHASLVCAAAILGKVLARLATTVRLLQQTEVAEAEEPFAVRQKGSSAMPHKRNPILSERVVGMARVLASYTVAALDDVELWHERDISHSAVERIILPDTCALLDYMLILTNRVVRGLRVDAARMRADVDHQGGITFSARVLDALVLEAGWTRERAYRAVQGLALRAREGEAGFGTLVAADVDVPTALNAAGVRLDSIFDPAPFLAHVDETYRRLGLPNDSDPSADPVDDAVGGAAGVPVRSETAADAGIGGGVLR